MEWLNYHHLLYFWTVAREGTVTRAAERLRISQPAISRQIQALEQSLQTELFTKSGRGLVLTEAGRVVYGYADEIFALGRELRAAVGGSVEPRRSRFAVGVVDVLPKMISYRLLRPAISDADSQQLIVEEGQSQPLLARLALHELDLVISDAPLPANLGIRGYSHLLGTSAISLFAVKGLLPKRIANLPKVLSGAPMLLPAEGTELRRSIDHWLESNGVRPRIVGSFADTALMKSFGSDGLGVFPAPAVIADEIAARYGVACVAELPDIRERYYAISRERKIRHAGVAAITEAARADLFR